jgi:thioredoxin reductase (NADPH)
MYDVIVIGGGPGGLSAALYTTRALLKTLILEKAVVGGLITTTTEIENYPGSNEDSTGASLTQRMLTQAMDAGAELEFDSVESVTSKKGFFELAGISGSRYRAKCLIIATGSHPRLLNIPGEEEFRGHGVSYCATCDAGFFKNKHVAVVGGGDTAIKEAEYLTKFASKVSVFVRRDVLRASMALVSKIRKNPKIQLVYNTVVEEIKGGIKVDTLNIKNTKTGESSPMSVDGIFIFAGYAPNSEVFKDMLQMNENGYIITDKHMKTSVDGIYAVGDVRDSVLRQVITAAADGAIAGVEAEKYLSE